MIEQELKISRAIKQTEEYIELYEGDKPYLKTKMERCLNNRTIEELKHILEILKNE